MYSDGEAVGTYTGPDDGEAALDEGLVLRRAEGVDAGHYDVVEPGRSDVVGDPEPGGACIQPGLRHTARGSVNEENGCEDPFLSVDADLWNDDLPCVAIDVAICERHAIR